jgi:hypothetical protein
MNFFLVDELYLNEFPGDFSDGFGGVVDLIQPD